MTRILARPLLSSLLSFSVLVVLLLDPAAAVAISTEQIPSPRPTGWTVDLTGTLPAETIADLNRLGDEVNAQTGGEMAVVVIGSTDGANARDFASQLFNQWGIGDAQTNRGILVFAALDDRSAEIILGRGLQGPEYVQVSEGIMQGDMVPRFRSGDASGAVFQGALSCAQQLFGATPTIAPAAPPVPDGALPAPAAPDEALEAPQYPTPTAYEPVDADSGVDVGKLVALGAVLLLLLSFALPSYLRYRPRRCSRCTTKMVRLDEEKDDAHLGEQERMEEQIGSVDYDVWACPSCGQALKLRHDRFGSGYSPCPECGGRTLSETSSILLEPTYHRSGEVRVDERCIYCPYHTYSTHSTPRLHRHDNDNDRWSSSSSSSSTSSSFSSSSSSHSSSSSSSSGSSSGGSFGGGSSSGSGASGRW